MRGADDAQTIKRWMYLWITLGLVIVAVVIGFLFGIANNLEGIVAGLDEASEAVQGAESDVKPLPAYISDINVSLAKVDGALDPLPELADRVIDNLGSIDGTLSSVESSLNDTESTLDTTEVRLERTEGLLNTTEARLDSVEATLDAILDPLADTVEILVDTDAELNSALGDLVSIFSLAERIERELELAQEFDSLGTNGIWRRVRFLNGGVLVRRENDSGLQEVEEDTDGIIAGLQEVAKHLENTCQFLPDLSIFRDPGQQPSGGVPIPDIPLIPGLRLDEEQRRSPDQGPSQRQSPTDDGQPPSAEQAPPAGGPPGAGEEEPPASPPAGGPQDTVPC